MAIATGVLAVTLAACGFAGAADTANAAEDRDHIAPHATWEPGPLDEFQLRLGRSVGGMGFDDVAQWYLTTRIITAETMAACMLEHGFDFEPHVENRGSSDIDPALATAPFGTREFVAAYGIEVSIDWSHIRRDLIADTGADPNEAIVESLSREAQREYRLAMSECRSRPGASFGLIFEHEFSALEGELDRFHFTWQDSPEMVALNQSWAACMAANGHSEFSAPGLDMRWALSDLWFDGVERFWGEPGEELKLPNGDVVIVPESGQIEIHARTEGEQVAFRDWERAVAVTDWDCRAQLHYDVEAREIELRYQQEFVDRHGHELEAWALHAESLWTR